jgi:hypothetical protein
MIKVLQHERGRRRVDRYGQAKRYTCADVYRAALRIWYFMEEHGRGRRWRKAAKVGPVERQVPELHPCACILQSGYRMADVTLIAADLGINGRKSVAAF